MIFLWEEDERSTESIGNIGADDSTSLEEENCKCISERFKVNKMLLETIEEKMCKIQIKEVNEENWKGDRINSIDRWYKEPPNNVRSVNDLITYAVKVEDEISINNNLGEKLDKD